MAEPSDQLAADFAASDISGNQVVANITRRGPGFLDLPPEIRRMIFCHLLIHPEGLDGCIACVMPRSTLDVLRTSRLIHREAFDVFYSENRFSDHFWWPNIYPSYRITQLPRVIEAMKNVQIVVYMGMRSPKFLNLVNLFGDQSIIRGTLAIELEVEGNFVRFLNWYVRALGRFTNFRTVELYFDKWSESADNLLARKYLQTNLEPVFGRAEDFEKVGHSEKGLRFHPVDHPDLRRNSDPGDWASFLDGIRLEWDET